MPRRASSAGLAAVTSFPSKKMLPRVGTRNLVSKLKNVVLPAPFGPINAWMWPRRTRKSTPPTATNPLNSFVRPRVSMIISSAIGTPDLHGDFSLAGILPHPKTHQQATRDLLDRVTVVTNDLSTLISEGRRPHQ